MRCKESSTKYAVHQSCKLLESLKLPLENALIVLEFDDGKDLGVSGQM